MSQELIISTADLATVTQDLKERADDVLEQAERAKIVERADYEKGTDFLKIVTGIGRRLEDKRKELVEPYGKRVRVINAEFKKVRDLLDRAKELAKSKMIVWHDAEEARERKAAAERRRQAEEDALAAAEKAEDAGEASTAEAILNMASEVPEPDVKPAVGRGELTGATAVTSKVWRANVTSVREACKAIAEGHLPEDLVVFPTSKLNALARDWHEKQPSADSIVQYGITVKGEKGLAAR